MSGAAKTPRRRAGGRVAGALLAGALLLTACGGDDGDEASATTRRSTSTSQASTTTTAETTTTTAAATTTTAAAAPAPSSEAAVLADYRAGWDAVLTALTANPPDPDFPLLLALHREVSLEFWREVVVATAQNGWVIEGDVELRPAVVSLDGTEAVVHDCYIDRAEARDASTGEVAVPAQGPQPVVFRLRLEGDRWRTYAIERHENLRGAMCA